MREPKRKRNVQLNFRVPSHELELIESKMAQMGTINREAYLRKMAIDGYVVKLDLPGAAVLLGIRIWTYRHHHGAAGACGADYLQ